MTEEQRKEYERLSDKKYSIGQTLTYGEESMFKALKRIKEQDRRDEQRLPYLVLGMDGKIHEAFIDCDECVCGMKIKSKKRS